MGARPGVLGSLVLVFAAAALERTSESRASRNAAPEKDDASNTSSSSPKNAPSQSSSGIISRAEYSEPRENPSLPRAY